VEGRPVGDRVVADEQVVVDLIDHQAAGREEDDGPGRAGEGSGEEAGDGSEGPGEAKPMTGDLPVRWACRRAC
jgi:hypothetical protein